MMSVRIYKHTRYSTSPKVIGVCDLAGSRDYLSTVRHGLDTVVCENDISYSLNQKKSTVLDRNIVADF